MRNEYDANNALAAQPRYRRQHYAQEQEPIISWRMLAFIAVVANITLAWAILA